MEIRFLVSLIIFGVVFQSSSLWAEDFQIENKTQLDLKKENTSLKDIDGEITNARLRVQLGAKSRWSFRSDLSYSGGSIEKPLKSVRPNYRLGPNSEEISDLSGLVGVNYRLTERDNLSFTTGITVVDPFHGSLTKPVVDQRQSTKDHLVDRYQVTTPSLNWSRGYTALGAQMISGLAYSHYTGSWMADIHALGALSVSQTILAPFGASRWSGGVSAYMSYTFYGGSIKNPSLRPYYQSGTFRRSDLGVGVYPFLDYAFNDKYSFYTLFGYFDFLKYKDEYFNNNKLLQTEPYQSLGVGISVTRDIYLYPNIQFVPKDIRSDRTNVALNVKLNI